MFLCVVLSCVGRGLPMGRSPVQRVLPKSLNGLIVLEVNSEPEQVSVLNPRKEQQIYNPTIGLCSLAHGLQCWTGEHRVKGSNPSRIRIYYCL